MKALVDSVVRAGEESDTAATASAAHFDDAMHGGEPAVVDGEHLVLASLTIDTFPFFLDSVMVCSLASLSSATPNTTRGPSNERDSSPFEDICAALTVVHNALTLYVEAEGAGFDLPAKSYVAMRSAGDASTF